MGVMTYHGSNLRDNLNEAVREAAFSVAFKPQPTLVYSTGELSLRRPGQPHTVGGGSLLQRKVL